MKKSKSKKRDAQKKRYSQKVRGVSSEGGILHPHFQILFWSYSFVVCVKQLTTQYFFFASLSSFKSTVVLVDFADYLNVFAE